MDIKTLNSQIEELREMFDSAGFNLRALRQLALQDYAVLSFKNPQCPTLAISEEAYNHPLLHHRVLAVCANAIMTGVALSRAMEATGNLDVEMPGTTDYAFNASNINPGTFNKQLPPLPLEWRLITTCVTHAEHGSALVEAFENAERTIRNAPPVKGNLPMPTKPPRRRLRPLVLGHQH